MAYVGIDGHKKQREMCLSPAAAPPHVTGAVRGGLCRTPHGLLHLGVIWRIMGSSGAACRPAGHDFLCCWSGASTWGRVAPLGWRRGGSTLPDTAHDEQRGLLQSYAM
jgi:hypothetical protein